MAIADDDLLALEQTPKQLSGPVSVRTRELYRGQNPNFAYFKTITIDRTKIDDAVCGTTLTNYPLLYSVTDTDLRNNVTDPEGDDINFVGFDDTTCGGVGTAPCTLDHEIEKWVGGTGELVAWVRIPSVNTINAGTDTVIKILYGDSSVTTSTQNAAGVWDTNYMGVWHLYEDVVDETAGATHFDSTSNNNDGTQDGNVEMAGKIADGQAFDGNDYIQVPDSLDWDTGGAVTIEQWFSTTTQQTGSGLVVHDSSNYKYLTYLTNNSATLQFYVRTASGECVPLLVEI